MKKLGLSLVLVSAVYCLSLGTIDLDNLYNYAFQYIPDYIQLDNTRDNAITDEGATLGRVLFYDKKLSSDNNTACASCHQQEAAFGDLNTLSIGSFGLTGRHSMRLVNARFSEEPKFFWDERALTLEEQTTQPIQDHTEMGYSGEFGNPDISELLTKLDTVSYYETLFELAFGDSEITEDRIQLALAQFVRSIQSFDSRYDAGRAMVNGDPIPFPNFTDDENAGKKLFLERVQFDGNGNRIGGGVACASCHIPPSFSIDDQSRSNGVFLAANGFDTDEGITRSPTLRDIFHPDGSLNGPLMHNGQFTSIRQVLEHYNDIEGVTGNASPPVLDARLKDGRFVQKLNMTEEEYAQVTAFLLTLTGEDVYTNEMWSDPFDADGGLTIMGGNPLSSSNLESKNDVEIYPNPVIETLHLRNIPEESQIMVFDQNGRLMANTQTDGRGKHSIDFTTFETGIYFVQSQNMNGELIMVKRIFKI